METRPLYYCPCLRAKLLKTLFFAICFGYICYPFVQTYLPGSRDVMIVKAAPSGHLQMDTCHGILNDARLSYSDKPWFHLRGCSLHNYTQSDAQSCMRRISSTYGVNSIAILGDSRARNFFVGLTKVLGKPNWDIPIPMRHADFHYHNPDIDTLVFMRFRGRMDSEIYNDYVTWMESPDILRPRVVIQGNALWDLTFGGTFEESSANFRGNLSKTLPYMDGITSSTDVLWMLQDPTDERKMDADNIAIRGEAPVNAYNNMTVDILSRSSVKIWKSARDVAIHFPNDSDSGGIHYGPRVIFYKVQLFLNWYCNRHMDFSDGTCCTRPDDRQLAILTVLHPFLPSIIIIILLFCILLVSLSRQCQKSEPHFTLHDLNSFNKMNTWKFDAVGN